jgi:hypothetical protein
MHPADSRCWRTRGQLRHAVACCVARTAAADISWHSSPSRREHLQAMQHHAEQVLHLLSCNATASQHFSSQSASVAHDCSIAALL